MLYERIKKVIFMHVKSILVLFLASVISINENATFISHSSIAAFISIETPYDGVTLSVEGRPDATVIAIDGFFSFNSANVAT